LLFVSWIDPDEDTTIVEDHQMILIPTGIFPIRLVEKVDLLVVICVENRCEVEPKNVRISILTLKLIMNEVYNAEYKIK
jgi:hypothetical protein